MKNKIKILLAVCAMFVFFSGDLFAWKVTLSGGGRSGYNYVYIDTERKIITCKFPGTTVCPVEYQRAVGQTGKEYSLNAIVSIIQKQVQAGKMNGNAKYEDGITYNWTAKSETDMEIEVVDFSK